MKKEMTGIRIKEIKFDNMERNTGIKCFMIKFEKLHFRCEKFKTNGTESATMDQGDFQHGTLNYADATL